MNEKMTHIRKRIARSTPYFLLGVLPMQAVTMWFVGKWDSMADFMARSILVVWLLPMMAVPFLPICVLGVSVPLMILAIKRESLWWLSLVSFTILAVYWYGGFYLAMDYPLEGW